MEKAKLIEKLKREYAMLRDYPGLDASKVELSITEIDLILTSLTAPVPDGKEEIEQSVSIGDFTITSLDKNTLMVMSIKENISIIPRASNSITIKITNDK